MMSKIFWLLILSACLDQYDPRPEWERFATERELAHRPYPVLAADGTLPQPAVQLDPVAAAREKYALYCSNCHGAKGAGDGLAGQALNPKPRDFRDATWQQSTSDERIAAVIKNGGVAVGLTATMAPFGAILTDAEIKLLVDEIRKFATE